MLQITAIKPRSANRFLATRLLVWLCLLIQGGPVMAASSSEEALRARVEQCYSALEQGDWQKVEKYLTKDSKPLFRSQTKKPLLAYKIQSIKIEPEGRTASVVVQIPIMSSVVPTPIPVPKTSLWRLINHTWYMELPRPDPNARQSLFGMAPRPLRSAPALAFSKDLKFESTWCGLGIVEGNGTQVARFPFKNVSTHIVTLADIQLGCDCLRLKTQQKEYKPGESGTLEIEFDPSILAVNTEQAFTQDIIIKTEPGGAYVKLTIGARVGPGPAPPAKP
jgi:hypothetical protein